MKFAVCLVFMIGMWDAGYSATAIIAHRGASGYLPEHTLEGVAFAHGAGADFIEADLVLTKDGVPVVLHDIHLELTTNAEEVYPSRHRKDGRWYAIDFTLDEIKRLQVHERSESISGNAAFPKRFPLALSKKLGLQVPTFREFIELVQGLNHSRGKNVGIYPEIKSPAFHLKEKQDISKVVLQVLDEYGYRDANSNIYLQCFDAQELRRIKDELRSKLKLVQLIAENSWGESETDYDELKTEAGLKNIARYAVGVGPWLEQLVVYNEKTKQLKPSDFVKFAKQAGLKIHPYTVRKDAVPGWINGGHDALLNFLIHTLHVDGVFTDFPDLSRNFLIKHPVKLEETTSQRS